MDRLKENKVEHFKSEAVEIKFSPLAFLPNVPETSSSEMNTDDSEELLYYSAPPRRQA